MLGCAFVGVFLRPKVASAYPTHLGGHLGTSSYLRTTWEGREAGRHSYLADGSCRRFWPVPKSRPLGRYRRSLVPAIDKGLMFFREVKRRRVFNSLLCGQSPRGGYLLEINKFCLDSGLVEERSGIATSTLWDLPPKPTIAINLRNSDPPFILLAAIIDVAFARYLSKHEHHHQQQYDDCRRGLAASRW